MMQSVCTPIDLDDLLIKAKKLIDYNIFSNPSSASELIQNTKFSPFIYIPYILVIVSIEQDFQNRSGSFYYEMDIKKLPFLLSGDGGLNNKILYNKSGKFVDFENTVDIVSQAGISIEKGTLPSIDNKRLKKYVQHASTTERNYRGQNNQWYTKTCRPKLSNIEIHHIYKYWHLHTDLDLAFDSNSKFRVTFDDDQIIRIEGMNFPNQIRNSREVRICNECNTFLFKGAPKNKFLKCKSCGKILCMNCISKTGVCSLCAKKFEINNAKPKKNKETLKSLKIKYKTWSQEKKNKLKINFS